MPGLPHCMPSCICFRTVLTSHSPKESCRRWSCGARPCLVCAAAPAPQPPAFSKSTCRLQKLRRQDLTTLITVGDKA
eukprot:1156793-Pelagomonas_calceolata.AAC.2